MSKRNPAPTRPATGPTVLRMRRYRALLGEPRERGRRQRQSEARDARDREIRAYVLGVLKQLGREKALPQENHDGRRPSAQHRIHDDPQRA